MAVFVDEVGLIDEVLAVGFVVIGRVVECRIGGVHRASQRPVTGVDVLVEFLVVGKERPVLHGQSAAEVVLDKGHQGLHVGARDV